MSKYQPFKVYKGLETRRIKDKNIKWAEFERKSYGNYIKRAIKEDAEEFGKTADLFRRAFPELYGNVYDFLLYPERYPIVLGEGRNFLTGEWYMTVTEYENDIVAAEIYKMFPQNMTIELAVGATDPRHRGRGLQRFSVKEVDRFVERCGAEYAYAACVVYHKASQDNLLEVGYRVEGITPGFISHWMKGDEYYRAPHVWMGKFYNGAERMVPDEKEWIMIP